MGRPRSTSARTAFGRWLTEKEISYVDAGEKMGIHPRYGVMLACGSVTPGLKLALRIAKWSEGAVPVDSWRKPAKKKRPVAK
jgi:hypothetical protein